MTPTIAEAERSLRYWAAMARLGHHPYDCAVCGYHQLRAEAAALAYDNAIAWTYSGREPRLSVKGIPYG